MQAEISAVIYITNFFNNGMSHDITLLLMISLNIIL